MIRLTIDGGRVVKAAAGRGYNVLHPTNDAILAYCDTRAEADYIVSELHRLPQAFRGAKVVGA